MKLFKPDSASRIPILPATPALVIPDFKRVFNIIEALSDNAIANNKISFVLFLILIG